VFADTLNEDGELKMDVVDAEVKKQSQLQSLERLNRTLKQEKESLQKVRFP
jgi:hypothetical protein